MEMGVVEDEDELELESEVMRELMDLIELE